MPWLRNSETSFLWCDSLRSNDACAASPRSAAALEEATHTSRAALRPGTAAMMKISARSGLRSCEPCGFRGDAWVCEFLTALHSVSACVVSPRDFGSAASLAIFQLWVQEGAARTAVAKSCPRSISESFLHVGDAVLRRQNTSCARIQVAEPFVGDMRVAQVFNPGNLLPGTFGEECALQTSESSPTS